MKKTILFLLIACFAAFLQAGYGLDEKKGSEMAWDFGNVEEGITVRHIFIMKNDSQAPLKIKELNTSCGCTGSAAKKKKLKPGESTEIEVKFNSRGYVGPITQHAYVHTDNLKSPIIRLTIKANVLKSEG